MIDLVKRWNESVKKVSQIPDGEQDQIINSEASTQNTEKWIALENHDQK